MKFFDRFYTGKLFYVTLTVVYSLLSVMLVDLFSVISTGTHIWVWWMM